VYPHVTQFETTRLEVERELQLTWELSLARTERRALIRLVLPALTRRSGRRLAPCS
jgi:hypothetical protein